MLQRGPGIGSVPARALRVSEQPGADARRVRRDCSRAGWSLEREAARSKARAAGGAGERAARRRSAREITALVVDEAQSLSTELLEEIRLLANIETTTRSCCRSCWPGSQSSRPARGARLAPAEAARGAAVRDHAVRVCRKRRLYRHADQKAGGEAVAAVHAGGRDAHSRVFAAESRARSASSATTRWSTVWHSVQPVDQTSCARCAVISAFGNERPRRRQRWRNAKRAVSAGRRSAPDEKWMSREHQDRRRCRGGSVFSAQGAGNQRSSQR